jgi:hypothetical protein
VLEFLGRLLGWLRGGAASAGSYALHVLLLLLPVLVANGASAVGSYVLRTLQLLLQLPALVAVAAPHVQHVLLQLAASVVAWAQAAGSCVLHVLQQLSALAVCGLQLACGAALALAFVYLARSQLRVKREWCQYLASKWELLQAWAWAYIMRERRWLAL